MYPRSMLIAKNKKHITLFHLKIIHFNTAVKNHRVLHGHVFVNRVAMKPIKYIFIAEILICKIAAERRN